MEKAPKLNPYNYFRLGRVTIAGGGVLPNIHVVLLPKRKGKKATPPSDKSKDAKIRRLEAELARVRNDAKIRRLEAELARRRG